jgi:LPXTG-motif cell wall-anchored protein
MKKQFLSLSAMFLLTAGAALAQSANTTAPGPTQQKEPAQTNNNLPNPGNPQTDLSHNNTYTENGTVEGTANENMQQDQGTTPTNTDSGVNSAYSTGTAGSTTGTTGTTTGTTGTTTDTTGTMDTTGTTGTTGSTGSSYGTTGTTGSTGSTMDSTDTNVDTTTDTTGTTGSLPSTGSEMPLVAMAGLLALASAFMVRRAAKRNA